MVPQGMQHGTSLRRARLDHCLAHCTLRIAHCALRIAHCALRIARCVLHLVPPNLSPHRADVHVLPLIADLIEVGKP